MSRIVGNQTNGRTAPSGQTGAPYLASWLSPASHRGLRGTPGLGARAGASFGARVPGALTAGLMPAAATGLDDLRAVGHGGLSGGLGSLGGFRGGADPLRGSELLLAFDGGRNAEGDRPGRRWQLWGQGDIQTFQGAPSAVTGYDGELLTGYMGVGRVADRPVAGGSGDGRQRRLAGRAGRAGRWRRR